MKYILLVDYTHTATLYTASSFWELAERDDSFNAWEHNSLTEAEELFEKVPAELAEILESGKTAYELDDNFFTEEDKEYHAMNWLRSDYKDVVSFDSEEEAVVYACLHPQDGIRSAILHNHGEFDVPFYGIVRIDHLCDGDSLQLVESDLCLPEARKGVKYLSKKSLHPTTGLPVLNHGECAPPKYIIVPQEAYDYIDTWDEDEVEWDGVDCLNPDEDGDVCLECKVCLEAICSQMIDYAEKNAVEFE